MRLVLIIVFMFAGCAMAPVQPGSPASGGGLGLPPPKGALEFSPGASEITLAELLGRFAQLTGFELALDPQTLIQLQQSKEPLDSLAPVPKEEVYAFVECLLVRRGFFFAPMKGGSRPLLAVYSATPVQETTLLVPLAVESTQFAELESHPALLVRLTVSFENIDSRQLQTQLRQLLVDSIGVRQVVPAGDRSLILQGLGADTAALVQLLRAVDAASAARPAPAPPPAPAGEAR